MTVLDAHFEGWGLAGRLDSDETLSVSVTYVENYVGPPLSLSLPLPAKSFDDAARETLSRIAFCNYLIGNAGAHAKNFSLLHAGERPVLVKLYDLVCSALHGTASQEFAMRIGGCKMWGDVERPNWLTFLEHAGFRGKGRDHALERMFKPMAEKVMPILDKVIAAERLGTSPAASIRDHVRDRLAHLNTSLGWASGRFGKRSWSAGSKPNQRLDFL